MPTALLAGSPIQIVGYGSQPAGVTTVWIASYMRAPPPAIVATEVTVAGFGGKLPPPAGRAPVRVVPRATAGATSIWISQ